MQFYVNELVTDRDKIKWTSDRITYSNSVTELLTAREAIKNFFNDELLSGL